MVSRTALNSAIAVALLLVGLSVSAQEIPEPVDGLLDKWNDASVKSSPASSWSTEHADLERNVGYNVSLAVDPKTGDKYISYYDGTNGDLWLARTGAPVGNCGYQDTWHCQALDTSGIVGKYSSIAVGGPGTHAALYITYYDTTNHHLKIVQGLVDRQTGDFSYEIYWLYYGKEYGDPADWEFAGKSSAIVLDSSGRPHVAFQYENSDGFRHVIYATEVPADTGNCGDGGISNDWQCHDFEYFMVSPEFISIDVDALGHPFIAFYREDTARIGYAFYCDVDNQNICGNGGPGYDYWIGEISGNKGKYMSVFVEDDGTPHMAYYNATTESLEYRIFRWAVPDDVYFIASVGSYGQPAGISIVHDGNGYPAIAYQDEDPVSGDLDLKIARPLAATNWGAFGNCGPVNSSGFQTWLCETLRYGAPGGRQAYGGLSIAADGFGDLTVANREFLFPPDGSPAKGRLFAPSELRSGLFLDDFEYGDTSAWSSTLP